MYTSWRLSIFVGSQVFGVLSVLFVLSTVLTAELTSKDMQWHSVLMALSVYLVGSSVTIYRGLPWLLMTKLKLFHTLIHISALVSAIAGVVLVFDLYNSLSLTHLISLHSIFGIITIILLALQLITGLLFFLHPKIPVRVEKHAVPNHATAGVIIFILGCVNSMIALNGFTLDFWGKRSDSVMLATASGFFIFIFMLLVLYLAMKDSFKREPLAEDK